MKDNQLFKIPDLGKKLSDIALADTSAKQKVKDLFQLANPILERIENCFSDQQPPLIATS